MRISPESLLRNALKRLSSEVSVDDFMFFVDCVSFGLFFNFIRVQHIYIYIHIYIHTYIYTYIYMYIWVYSFPSSFLVPFPWSGFVHYSFFVPSMRIAQIVIGIWLWYSFCCPCVLFLTFISLSFFLNFFSGYVHYVFFVPSTLIAQIVIGVWLLKFIISQLFLTSRLIAHLVIGLEFCSS